MKSTQAFVFLFAASSVGAVFADSTLGLHDPGARYATDAYPGFDTEDNIVAPSKKEPRWFAWINGPNQADAASQFAYCQALAREGNWSKAAKQLDALVREWPTAEEAARAQKELADILLGQLGDCVEAFAEYRYLMDFYSLQCDYDKIAEQAYKVANVMRQEGKRFIFFRFDNTVDVRRAYEAVVLRAPGASYIPEAMLTIAELRGEEGKPEEAVKVYENLRNLHPETPEAKRSWLLEARVRMGILNDHEYNRERYADTIDYFRMALMNGNDADIDEIKGFLAEATAHTEEEAYRAARFYDSRTRTERSAVNAYERFLADYPDGVHAEEVRARLNELKGIEE